MTSKEYGELLDIVIARAPKLREAGVLELGEPGGFHVKLAPAVVADPVEEKAEADEPSNPWNDPLTFGRRRGVPGRNPQRKDG